MTINLSAAEKAEILAGLQAGKPIEEILQLEDFSHTLESVILDRLAALDEPVFTNPTTGQAASSVFAVLDALDYTFTLHWSQMVRPLERKGGDAVFKRHDLKKSNSKWPTVCIDLNIVESLLPLVQPRKAKKVIEKFKTEHGL
jgi:hypothetical protein